VFDGVLQLGLFGEGQALALLDAADHAVVQLLGLMELLLDFCETAADLDEGLEVVVYDVYDLLAGTALELVQGL
jgi:hypothetical protein